jgi:hypothetical protein
MSKIFNFSVGNQRHVQRRQGAMGFPMRQRILAVAILTARFMTGCGGGSSYSPPTPPLPPAIAVVIQNKISGSVIAGGSVAVLTATVNNDSSGSGVAWTLIANSVACTASTCGTLTNVTTSSATYVPPASAPASPNNAPTITATSVKDSSKSDMDSFTVVSASTACGSGHESILNGQYAFTLQGFDTASAQVLMAGSFNADGAGHIATLVGVEDINSSAGPQANLSINATGSSYSIGADNRGCLTLVNSLATTRKFRFALGSLNGGVASKGRISGFDATTAPDSLVTGELRIQNPAAFANSAFAGNYAFGLDGTDIVGKRFGVAGTLSTNGAGVITAGNLDSNDGGVINTNAAISSGTFAIAANGRGTLSLTSGGVTDNYAIYMLSNSDALLLSVDANSTGHPVTVGEALAAGASFANNSLNGTLVIHMTGRTSGGSADVTVGVGNSDGGGNLSTLNLFEKSGNNPISTLSGSATYSVAANGRATFMGDFPNAPVAYLSAMNQGFIVGGGVSAQFGIVEPQSAGPFSNSSVSGAYFFGTETAGCECVPEESGVATANGTGGLTGTLDSGRFSGLLQGNQPLPISTYSVMADGTGNVGPGTELIVISATKLLWMDASINPAVTILQK